MDVSALPASVRVRLIDGDTLRGTLLEEQSVGRQAWCGGWPDKPTDGETAN